MAKNIRLTIGEFSRYCGVTVKTLRHYERMGLLVPNEVDEWTRYRYYDVAQMQQAQRYPATERDGLLIRGGT